MKPQPHVDTRAAPARRHRSGDDRTKRVSTADRPHYPEATFSDGAFEQLRALLSREQPGRRHLLRQPGHEVFWGERALEDEPASKDEVKHGRGILPPGGAGAHLHGKVGRLPHPSGRLARRLATSTPAAILDSSLIITDFGDLLAARMRSAHQTLAGRWFERLQDLLPVGARDVFPTESLLDHVPALILQISDYLRHPSGEAIASNTAILEKAQELGALRHSQRASLHQVLREYQILGRVLVAFVTEELENDGTSVPATEAVALIARLQQAVDVLAQATVETFVGLYTQTIADQADRLDQFTRMAVHEWRQPLGALAVGVRLIREAGLEGPELQHMLARVERHVRHLAELTGKLEAIARVRSSDDNAVVQRVPVASVAQEAARQLREMAEARGVEVRIADSLPVLTVDVGRLELVLVNLLSNAIKYSDPAKSNRFVEVFASPPASRLAPIHVRDNGIGIPEASLGIIFQRFTRAHEDRAGVPHVGGMGLGLSIVDECVRAMGGEIGVESAVGQGTTFTIALPAGHP